MKEQILKYFEDIDFYYNNPNMHETLSHMIDELIEEVRPKGEWILDDGLRRIRKCSNCGRLILTDDIDFYKYCHGCGAEMRGKS